MEILHRCLGLSHSSIAWSVYVSQIEVHRRDTGRHQRHQRNPTCCRIALALYTPQNKTQPIKRVYLSAFLPASP